MMELEPEAVLRALTMKMDQTVPLDDLLRSGFISQTKELRAKLEVSRGKDAYMAFASFVELNEVAVDTFGVHFTVEGKQYLIRVSEDSDLCIAVADLLVRLRMYGEKADFIGRYPRLPERK